jgi:hypothetical protein
MCILQGWFTMYYNMMQPHEIMEAQGEHGDVMAAFFPFVCLFVVVHLEEC